MTAERPTLAEIAIKAVVVHTVTYFVVGILAFVTLEYSALYSDPSITGFVRQTSDPLVTAGPLFQPVRGFLFGVLFYLLREPFFGRRNGWLLMWATLVVVGIIGPFGAAPGSLEGLICTRLPIGFQLIGLPEILIQSLFLSGLLFYWVRHPEKRWLSWVLGIAISVIILLSALGLLAGRAG